LLKTVIVYVTTVPGVAEGEKSVFVIPKSAVGVNVSESVLALLELLGSVTPMGGDTVAVLVSKPVAPASIVALTV
jgi:hypothetical protein